MEALINMICDLKITSGSKKNCVQIHGDPTLRWKVISEKQCYAAMKYIVDYTLLFGGSGEECKYNCAQTQEILEKAGFWVNFGKTHLVPSMRITFLGLFCSFLTIGEEREN